MKDRSYHESAIIYNEGLAIAAEEQAERVTHPIPKKWNAGVAKQHRFHLKRHQSALAKLIEREGTEPADGTTSDDAQLDNGKGI